jgi:hypothetical protein
MRVDSLPLRFAPAGNDTERVTLRVKLGVIPGEPQAREGDLIQNVAHVPSPLRGGVGVAGSKLSTQMKSS